MRLYRHIIVISIIRSNYTRTSYTFDNIDLASHSPHSNAYLMSYNNRLHQHYLTATMVKLHWKTSKHTFTWNVIAILLPSNIIMLCQFRLISEVMLVRGWKPSVCSAETCGNATTSPELNQKSNAVEQKFYWIWCSCGWTNKLLLIWKLRKWNQFSHLTAAWNKKVSTVCCISLHGSLQSVVVLWCNFNSSQLHLILQIQSTTNPINL